MKLTIRAIRKWPLDKNGFHIAPAGVEGVRRGNRIKVGKNVRAGIGLELGNRVVLGYEVELGHYVKLGNNVQIGPVCSLGNHVELGNGVTLGEYVDFGDDITLGSRTHLPSHTVLGDGLTLGPGVTEAYDLGYCDLYRKAIACVDGVAWIAAGCRWFTLAEALEHWEYRESEGRDRKLTRAIMLAAAEIARVKGWYFRK